MPSHGNGANPSLDSHRARHLFHVPSGRCRLRHLTLAMSSPLATVSSVVVYQEAMAQGELCHSTLADEAM
jgi:hypothetical protein